MENNTLIKYIRNKKGQPRGVVVALRDNNEVCYGYSICNPIDPWNKHKGLKIAIARALAREYDLPKSGEYHQADHGRICESF